jgi:hypothetical protein
MKRKFVILILMVVCLTISIVSGAEIALPQGKTVPNANPSILQAQNNNASIYGDLTTVEIPSTPDSKTPVIRYTNTNIPSTINDLIDHIDFQTTSDKKGQAYIYFKLPASDASVNRSREIANFIFSRKEWKGDRTEDSVTAEVYIHWVADNVRPLLSTNPINEQLYQQAVIGANDSRPSPIYPTHLGYYYSGLDKTNLMDQFLLTL